jgi:hypothetical protein
LTAGGMLAVLGRLAAAAITVVMMRISSIPIDQSNEYVL